ncbi:hypothetical protein [Methylobacterium sp. J-068]|uniref:hypothetical protein n=1 Tax=Methylobacterium sp. J-068 TaxID=2836649 RepID=UPI001FBC104F|nr:hypothetical protein [Methylobacterium sp. J-068]MCJ2033960.1 hypothetical protein [Methylobacterium sp. J-068]
MTDNASSERPYRALLLDAVGRVLRTKVIPARDESEAIERARAFMDGRPVELREGDRLVVRIEASDTSMV